MGLDFTSDVFDKAKLKFKDNSPPWLSGYTRELFEHIIKTWNSENRFVQLVLIVCWPFSCNWPSA